MDNKSCHACGTENTRENALVPAARHPPLKGSRFVGSRGVRDLFVCRECGDLWQTWYDQREDCHCRRSYVPTIIPVFAADTSLTRLVSWVATDYSRPSYGITDALATRLIRRRPEGLNEGVAALVRRLGDLSPPVDGTSMERVEMLFHLLGLAVERAVRGDLRPKGPGAKLREKPPARYRDAEVREAAAHFQPRDVGGVTRLPLTHDVVRRLLWESRRGPGPSSPERAVIAIPDPSPIIRFLDQLPLAAVRQGVMRGICAATAFKAAGKLNNLGLLPENDHAIWLPKEDWKTLEALVDPLERLAASWRRICAAAQCSPTERTARLQMEALLARDPIRLGARFTDSARRTLTQFEREFTLSSSAENSQSVASLREILELEERGLEADGRCVLADTR